MPIFCIRSEKLYVDSTKNGVKEVNAIFDGTIPKISSKKVHLKLEKYGLKHKSSFLKSTNTLT